MVRLEMVPGLWAMTGWSLGDDLDDRALDGAEQGVSREGWDAASSATFRGGRGVACREDHFAGHLDRCGLAGGGGCGVVGTVNASVKAGSRTVGTLETSNSSGVRRPLEGLVAGRAGDDELGVELAGNGLALLEPDDRPPVGIRRPRAFQPPFPGGLRPLPREWRRIATEQRSR
jgi:hypothetical protein